MVVIYPKSYSKFTFQDLKSLGLKTVIVDLFEEEIGEIEASDWLKDSLKRGANFSLMN